MRFLFDIEVEVDSPVVIGQYEKSGRRQLIPILSGTLNGSDPFGASIKGTVMPGGVDSQVIRPDGKCELSARYAVRLDDGRSFYVENNGIRTVPPQYAAEVFNGGFIPPELYYFATCPSFEVYDPSMEWLTDRLFVCKARREPDKVTVSYYMVE